MEAERKDIVWLDYARFIGIFLVVFGHALQKIPDWQNIGTIKLSWDYIYLFHMPLFFVISGYLYRKEETQKANRGGVKILYTLVIPYIFYQVIYLPVALFQYRHQLSVPELCQKLFLGIIAGDGYETPYSLPICLPCWFIICIIQLRILFLAVHINRKTSIGLSFLSMMFLLNRHNFGFDVYFCIDSTIMAIPYFLFGHYLKKIVIRIDNSSYWLLVGGVIISGFIVWLALQFNGAAQMNGPSYGNNLLFNYVAGCCGSIMVFLIAVVLSKLIGA